jgi:hypothetical protein
VVAEAGGDAGGGARRRGHCPRTGQRISASGGSGALY